MVVINRPFVGRGPELARLDALLAAARSGRPQLACVAGPAGIGKSTLLDQLRRRQVGADEVAVVAVTAEQVESQRPYAVLGDVSAALDRAAPYRPLPAGADPFTVGLGLLGRLVAAGPVLLLVDDAQWMDAASVTAMLFALRRLRAEPVLTVLSIRTGEPLSDDLSRAVDRPTTERLDLGGLDLDATAALCEQLTGGVVSPARAGRLRAATDGNPLWLTAAAGDSARAGRTDPAEPLPPPPQYAELIARQLDACTPDVRAVAVALAVTGPTTVREVTPVYEAAGGDAAGIQWPDQVVAEATAARLISVDAGGLRPHHALTASAVYWSLPAAHRASLHRRAAASTGDTDRRLDHRCAAAAVLTDDALRADLLARAAELRADGSSLRSAALTLAAAERTADAAVAATLRSHAALDLIRGGDLDGATEISAHTDQTAETAPALAVRGTLALLQGRPVEAGALLNQGFDRSGDDRYVAGICASQLTALIINLGRGEETLRWARRSAELTPGDGTTQLMLAAAEGVLLDGPSRWDEPDAPAPALAGAIAGRGVQLMWSGEDAAASAALQEGVDLALRAGPMLVGIIAGYYLAEVRFRLGDLTGALAVSDTTLSLAHDSEMVWTWTLAHATRVGPLVATGRLAEAREHLEVARASSTGDYASVLWLGVAGARLALACGDHAGALTAAASMEAHADAAGADNPAIQPWRVLQATALTGLGRYDEAAALLGVLETSLHRWERPWAAVQAARARAALHRARGEVHDAERVLAAAVEAYGGQPSREAALLVADHGALLRRRGKRADARQQLLEAAGRLAAMGAAPDAEAVDAELATLDGRAGPGTLTGRERAIVDLVVGGATNREVAATLHVSVKTVEYHLGHAFAKLGVHSRGGLGVALTRTASV